MFYNNKKQMREIMPPILTILIMLIIISIVGIIKVKQDKDKYIPSIKSSMMETQDLIELNNVENGILKSLINNLEETDNQIVMNSNPYFIYMNNLINYLRRTKTVLSTNEFHLLEEKSKELNEIMILEKERDFTKMSLDGRAVALDIAGQIYEMCGLKLSMDMKGNIEEISDQYGHIIYQENNQIPHSDFHTYVFIITFTTIIILITVIIIIGKKNQLFRREVIYDGIEEKRYA